MTDDDYNSAGTVELYELDARSCDQLVSSAPLLWDWSRTACAAKARGGMEEWAKSENGSAPAVHTCDWYHGTWQLLRLLNMVAVPPWYSFYPEALTGALLRRPHANVLISAAADYGMLCTLHEAVVAADASPRITMCDICATPLLASQWYAARHGLTLACVRDDLLSTERLAAGAFDLIVTDELLTVLKAEHKPLIVDRWRHLLTPGGVVVTTAMIGEPTTPEHRHGYAERARRLIEQHAERFESTGASREELFARVERFARYHTRHMVTGEEEIRALFADFELELSCIVTPGECVNPTSSFQIVASARQGEATESAGG